MLGISFELLAGRYHATPWGHHVNEGLVEWPPSPLRIARALAAASFRCATDGDPAVRALLCRIGASAPAYVLPPSTSAHTRHYMPQLGRNAKTARVLDTFVAVDRRARSTIEVWWPDIDRDASTHSLLGRLLPQVQYLGRAESWVEAKLLDNPPDGFHAEPVEDSASADAELHRLMGPAELAAWRDGFLAAGGKKADVPAEPWDALLHDTGVLQRQRWSSPPGFTTTRYRVRQPTAHRTRRRARDRSRPTVAVFALNHRVLPPAADTLDVAESFRRGLMARARQPDGSTLSVFSGKHPDGTPRRGNRHARILPATPTRSSSMTPSSAASPLDRVLIHAPEGFGPEAVEALQRLDYIIRRQPGGERTRLPVQLLGLGDARAHAGQDPEGLRFPHLGRASEWVSATPFVCTRHPKRRGGRWVETPADQLAAAAQRGIPDHIQVEVLPLFEDPQAEQRWASRFRRLRQRGGGRHAGGRGHGFRLRFSAPIDGPISFGYGAHFGLGQFVPVGGM